MGRAKGGLPSAKSTKGPILLAKVLTMKVVTVVCEGGRRGE